MGETTAEPRRRKLDNPFWGMIPRLIELLVIAAVFYGGFKVTIEYLSADVKDLKAKMEGTCLKVNSLEEKFGYIKESLDEIKRTVKGR